MVKMSDKQEPPAPLGERRLVKAGVPARAARHAIKLANSGGWELTIERALILAALPIADRQARALEWGGVGMAFTPEKVPGCQPPKKKKPAAAKPTETPKPKPPENPDSHTRPGTLVPFPKKPPGQKNPDRPQPHGGSLKTGSETYLPPCDLDLSDVEPEDLADSIRFLRAQVARARAVYNQVASEGDPMDEEHRATESRALAYYVHLTKQAAALTRDLEGSGLLGDTRSVVDVVQSLTAAASMIRARLMQVPDLLDSRMSAAGPDQAAQAGTASAIAKDLLIKAMNILADEFQALANPPQ